MFNVCKYMPRRCATYADVYNVCSWIPCGLLLWSLAFTMRKDEAAMVARLHASVARCQVEGPDDEADQVRQTHALHGFIFMTLCCIGSIIELQGRPGATKAPQWQEASKKNRKQARPNFGPMAQNDHPPPKPPFLTTYINKKGAILLRTKAAICLHSSHAKSCST
jgi:hypothetical protein